MEVGLKFVLVVLLLPIVQVLPLKWVNEKEFDLTFSSDSVTKLKIVEFTAESVNATFHFSTDVSDEEILPYVSLSCRKSGSKSAFDGDSCDNLILVNGQVFVVEVKVDTITLPVISNHTLQVVVEVNAEIDELKPVIDEPPPVNLLVLDERKLQVGFATEDMELKDNAIELHVEVLNKTLSLGADLELWVTLTDGHQQEIIQNFTLASDASEQLVKFDGLDPSRVYTAQLSVVDPAQQGRVLLVTPTARLKLEDILRKMDTNWKARFDKFSADTYQNASEMYQKASDLFKESVRLQAAVEELLNPSTTEDTTATVAPTNSTAAPSLTPANTKSPVIVEADNSDLPTDKAEESNAYYWLLFAGFVAVLVLCVLGYLLFNRRDKVKVYAVSLWKGAENTGKSSSSKTAGRKYTALPTSIHDTLTHED